jgi:hypothetical protein
MMTERAPTLRCIICGREMFDITGALPGAFNCVECGNAYRKMLEGLKPRAEMPPHDYVPSWMHMGDCAVCGHLRASAIHSGGSAQ